MRFPISTRFAVVIVDMVLGSDSDDRGDGSLVTLTDWFVMEWVKIWFEFR